MSTPTWDDMPREVLELAASEVRTLLESIEAALARKREFSKADLAGYPCTNKGHGADGSVRDENGECAKCKADTHYYVRPAYQRPDGGWIGAQGTNIICTGDETCVICRGVEVE